MKKIAFSPIVYRLLGIFFSIVAGGSHYAIIMLEMDILFDNAPHNLERIMVGLS